MGGIVTDIVDNTLGVKLIKLVSYLNYFNFKRLYLTLKVRFNLWVSSNSISFFFFN